MDYFRIIYILIENIESRCIIKHLILSFYITRI